MRKTLRRIGGLAAAVIIGLTGVAVGGTAAFATTNTCGSTLAACSYPTAASTGPYASMTAATGNYTVSVQYSHLQNWDIAGCLTITGSDITVSNVRIHGNCAYGILVDTNALRVTLKDVEIDCNGTTGTGTSWHDVKIIRADIHGCENGIDVSAPGNVVVKDTWIHDLTTGGVSHSDGIQVGAAVDGVKFDHNTIDGDSTWNSPLMLYGGGGTQTSNLWIHHNYISGGGYGIQCAHTTTTNNVIEDNRFGTFSYGPVSYCTLAGGHLSGWSENIYDADETAVAQF